MPYPCDYKEHLTSCCNEDRCICIECVKCGFKSTDEDIFKQNEYNEDFCSHCAEYMEL